MSGVMAAIAGGTALASIGGSMYSASQQRAGQQDQLGQAMQNYMLNKQMAEQQQRMAEAGRTDAAGNKVYFNGKDWVTAPTAATSSIIGASQANEREQQVAGGTRRELGQENNFKARGNAGGLAASVLRELQNRAGAPTLEGVRGRNTIAAATRVGANRDSLVDAVSRNVIRGGSSSPVTDRAIQGLDDASSRSLRTSIADSDAAAPEQYRQQREGWETGMLNKYAPLSSVATNLTDAPFAPTTVGAPIDAQLGQAATYGAATSGRGATGINSAAGTYAGLGTPSAIPFGPAAGALGDTVMAYLKNRKNAAANGAGSNTSADDPSYNRGF